MEFRVRVNEREVARDWSELLLAMSTGNDLGEAPTCSGYLHARELRIPLAQVATVWCQDGVTWTQLQDEELRGLIGPPRPAMASICMRRVGTGWRFAGWAPGQ
jgi:hypothetical protein